MNTEDKINEILIKYIANDMLRNHLNNIASLYYKNDVAHGIEHCYEVLNRAVGIFESVGTCNHKIDLIIISAIYHDLGCHVDRKSHHIISARMLRDDKCITRLFVRLQ